MTLLKSSLQELLLFYFEALKALNNDPFVRTLHKQNNAVVKVWVN